MRGAPVVDRQEAEDRLRELFFAENGYSCAQVTLIALREIFGIDDEAGISQGYALGGGVGHTGQGWCDGLLGGAMAVGELCAQRLPESSAIASATWPIVQELHDSFVREFGHSECSGLLGFSIRGAEGAAEYDRGTYKEDICFRNLLFVIRQLLLLSAKVAWEDCAAQTATTSEEATP